MLIEAAVPCLLRVIRDRVEPVASAAMSTMLPKAEANLSISETVTAPCGLVVLPEV
jgi:hypothetical protein